MLRLEELEVRAVPAQIMWDGGPSGNGTNWLNAVNWVGDALPGAGDVAVIGNTGTNPAITLSSATVHGVNSSRPLQVSGTLSISVDSSFSSLTLLGGVLSGLNGAGLINSSISGSGVLSVPGGADLSVVNSNISTPVSVQGLMLVRGSVSLSGGGSVAAAGVIRIQGEGGSFGPAALTVSGGLNVAGALELTSSVGAGNTADLLVTGSDLTVAAGGSLSVLGGIGGARHVSLAGNGSIPGRVIIQGSMNLAGIDVAVTATSSPTALVNDGGTITSEAGRILTIAVPLDHRGGTFSGPGTLALASIPITLSGGLSTASGAVLDVSGCTIAGPGAFTVASGVSAAFVNTSVSSPVSVQGMLLARSAMTFSGGLSVASGGILRVQGEGGSLGPATLSVTNGLHIAGTLQLTSTVGPGNTADVRVTGSDLTIALGGTLTGLAGAGGARFVSLGAAGSTPGRLINQGTVAVSETNLTVLPISGVAEISSSGVIAVATGRTLTLNVPLSAGVGGAIIGTGTIAGTAVGGSEVSPGTLGTGVLTFSGSLAASGPVAIELNGTTAGSQYDRIAVNGSISVGGPLNLSVGFVPAPGNSFTIIENDGSDPVGGSFAGLPQGGTTTVGSWVYQISYVGGTGNDVLLTVVPARVLASRINDGAQQRSRVTAITVTFNTQVSFATTPGSAFTLTRNGGPAVQFQASASVVNGVSVVLLNGFAGSEVQFGSLRDGRFTLTALASEISVGGLPLDGDANGTAGGDFIFGDAQGLFRLFGDMTGDRRVDISDFGFISLAYFTPANYSAALDFNGDGRIDITDFGQFSARFFTTLP